MVAYSLSSLSDSCVSHLSCKYLTFPDFTETCKVLVCLWRPSSVSPVEEKQKQNGHLCFPVLVCE